MMSVDPSWTLILAPIDQGTRNVGGRDGARHAPSKLLAALEDAGRIPAGARVHELEVGNTGESLERDLDRLSQAVEQALDQGRLPIVLGGDHGTTYATTRGAARALGDVGVAYLDVHLDVRDHETQHTSGSSFRRLIEEGWVDPEHVRALGIQVPEDPQRSTGEKASFAALRTWAGEQGLVQVDLEQMRADPGAQVREALSSARPWCFSIDVDALDARWAPGVSAPGAGRLTLEEGLQAARAARGRYRVLDIVEYAPRLDEGDRTLESCLALLDAALPAPS